MPYNVGSIEKMCPWGKDDAVQATESRNMMDLKWRETVQLIPIMLLTKSQINPI